MKAASIAFRNALLQLVRPTSNNIQKQKIKSTTGTWGWGKLFRHNWKGTKVNLNTMEISNLKLKATLHSNGPILSQFG